MSSQATQYFRVSRPYDDLSGAIQALTDKTGRIVVYEHAPDTGCNRPHIHVLMELCTVGVEQVKKIIKKHYLGELQGGNETWSWKLDEGKLETQEDIDKIITYLSKGTLEYKHLKGYDIDYIEERRKAWVTHTGQTQLATKLTQRRPDKEHNETNGTKPEKYDELKAIIEAYGSLTKHEHPTLDSVRRFVFHWYWRRDGKIPPATQYKRMAGSLFLRIAEEHPNMVFTVAMDEVLNLWF